MVGGDLAYTRTDLSSGRIRSYGGGSRTTHFCCSAASHGDITCRWWCRVIWRTYYYSIDLYNNTKVYAYYMHIMHMHIIDRTEYQHYLFVVP